MSAGRVLGLAALGLALAATVGAVRAVGALPPRAVELGRTHLVEPDPELVALLRARETPLHVSWFVTAEPRQPSDRRGLGRRVAELLARLADAAPGRFAYTVADPAEDPDLARYAARRGVTPFHATGVRGDATASVEVHATLLLEAGLGRPARLEHLGPEHLPHLQRLLIERLRESASPSAPRLLLVRPAERAAELATLEGLLAARGELRVTDDQAWAGGPDALWPDLCLWIGPGAAAVPAEVDRYLESGRALVLADPLADPGAGPLLADLGLEARPLTTDDGRATSIAPDQDFRLLDGQPDGTLVFEDPAWFAFDAAALDRRGASGRHLATTAETDAAPKRGLVTLVDPVDPRQGRVVALASAWPLTDGGLAPAAAGPSPAPGVPPPGANAHRPLLDLLVTSFTGADRRVLLRALPEPPARAVALSAGARWAVRAALWLPLPLVLVATVLVRRGRRRGDRAARPGGLPAWLPEPGLVLGLAAVLAVAWLTADARWPRLDATRGRLATPTATLSAVAADLADEVPGGSLHAELLLSRPGRLPLGLRDLGRRVDELVDACRAAGLDLTLERVEPEALDDEGRAVLEARGYGPFHHDLAGGRTRAWASLILTAGSRELLLEFAEAREGEELEFRLALALERLRLGRDPVLGLATDLPRMSAAEDYEFQSRGSFAPREGDVFGRARHLLDRAGFELVHLNPRRSDVAAADLSGLDALVWLQPRREARPMLDALARHLVGGGRALVAAQPYRTQVRQYRGADFEPVFWPQPQLTDLERFWLPELGATLEPLLVMDRLQADLPLQERVTAGTDDTSFATRSLRRPFLVRVPSEALPADPRLEGVGDLGLADPGTVTLDAPRLAAAGLEARPLVRASAGAWTVDWQGGWLTEAMLAGPEGADGAEDRPRAEVQGGDRAEAASAAAGETDAEPSRSGSELAEGDGTAAPEVGSPGSSAPVASGAADDAAAFLAGRDPLPIPAPEALLAVELTGTFPPPVAAWDDLVPLAAGATPGGPGRLVLLGNSAFLTDPMLVGATRGDGLLLNLVADLALEDFGPHGAELAALARRRPVAVGFAPPEDRTRALARLAVIGGGPLLLVLTVLGLRALGGRRRPRLASGGATTAAHGRGAPAADPALAPAPGAAAPTVATAPAPRGGVARRALAGPAVLAALTWSAAALAGGDGGHPTGDLRIGRPLAPDLRDETLAAVRVSRAPRAGEPPASFTWVHQAGRWRELEGLGALGDGAAIGALVEALFEAEGRVVHPGTGDLTGWELEPEAAWRVELFGPPELGDAPADAPAALLAALDAPFAAVEVGLQTREATEAWLRVDGDPALWQVDRSPRPPLDATWRPAEGAAQALPPLTDRALVARSWPGRGLALDAIAWQRRDAASLRLVRTAVERTSDELRTGRLPFAWRLVGSGEAEVLDGGLTGEGADAFVGLVLGAETTELLDPTRAAAYGFGPGAVPDAIVLVQCAPGEAYPEGLALTLELGPPLPPELGGGRAVLSPFAGNLLRIPEELAELLLPPREAFGDRAWTRRWQTAR